MPNLITTTIANVTIATCPATCYQAQSTDCACICGGLNHGVGLEQAIANVKAHAADLLRRWHVMSPHDHGLLGLEVGDENYYLLDYLVSLEDK